MLKNLLPEDSRLAELASAISIIMMGLLIASGHMTTLSYTSIFSIQREEFWSTIFLIFGSVQLTSLFYYFRLDILRCLMSLVSGSFLIWISLGTIVWDIQLTDIATFILGMSNLYAFVINSVQVGKTWEK